MTRTLTVKVEVDTESDRIAVWKDGIGWVEMDRGWFAALLDEHKATREYTVSLAAALESAVRDIEEAWHVTPGVCDCDSDGALRSLREARRVLGLSPLGHPPEREAEAPPPIEDGADSAIAIHSADGDGWFVSSPAIPAADADGRTESRRTTQGPPDEADGAEPSVYARLSSMVNGRDDEDVLEALAMGLALMDLCDYAADWQYSELRVRRDAFAWWAGLVGGGDDDEAMGGTMPEAVDAIIAVRLDKDDA